MMHNSMKTPVHSEYRHSKGQFQAKWFQHHQIKSPFQTHWYQPYVLQEHVTTVAQRDQKTFAYNPTQERNLSRSTEKNRKIQLLLALIISSALQTQCYRIKRSENENKPFAP